MKKILLIVLLFISANLEAQVAQATISFGNINQMRTYNGTYTQAIITDIDSAGLFIKKISNAPIDNMTYFEAYPSNYRWIKIANKSSGSNTQSATQIFVGDGNTYDFTISTPNINNFSAPVYLDYKPGDELPPTQGANSVTLHYNLPPPAGQSFTVKIIYTISAP